MSEFIIKIPKVSDRSLVKCLSGIYNKFPNKSKKATIRLLGGIDVGDVKFDQKILPENLEEALKYNSKLINSASLEIEQFSINFSKGGFESNKSAVYDELKIIPNNTSLKPIQKLNIISTLSTELKAFDPSKEPSGILSEEQQLQLDIHMNTIKELENRIAELSTKITNDLLANTQKLQSDYIEKQDQLSKKYNEDRSKMEAEYNTRFEDLREKANALSIKEQTLDLRDHTTARRGLRNDFLDAIRERFTDFKLTSDTRNLRIPIHIACCLILGASVFATISFANEFLGLLSSNDPVSPNILLLLGLKQITFTIIAGTTIIFYLKWMNRWFDKHTHSELHLKQLHLDFERANWLVETVLEWKKETKDSIPVELLLSLTKNLFSGVPNEDENQSLHPSDQVANAIVGNATKARVKIGNADVEIDRQGLQKAKKEVT